jgi:hypothetical protein
MRKARSNSAVIDFGFGINLGKSTDKERADATPCKYLTPATPDKVSLGHGSLLPHQTL